MSLKTPLHPPVILIVDDDRPGSDVLAAMLEAEKYAVRYAGSGEAALAEVARALPDLILLDIMMPGMDGYEVVARLKTDEHARAVPVIMLTVLDDRESKLRALESGAEEFLTKPVDRADLLARVRNLLRLKEYCDQIFAQAALLDKTNRRLEAEIGAHQAVETALNKTNIQLQAANEELEAFGYSVSHDLRAPLRAIEGFARIMAGNHEAPDPRGQDYVRRVIAAAEQMDRLIDDLIKLARVTRSEMRVERIDLSAPAREIAQNLQKSAPQRRGRFDIEPGVEAHGDAGWLRVVLVNLLGNAWKYTSGRDEAIVEFGRRRQGDETVYFVRDNGAGFDMRHSARLFGAFQRLHPATEFPGDGIGLATVRRIIVRHGGRVWAEGEVNKGATFYFTLP